MARRTGAPEIVKVAQNMCRLITKFAPILKSLYPSGGVPLALDTALAACAALDEALRAEAIEAGV